MTVNNDRTPRYTVKEVSALTHLSPHAVRYYDDVGLLPFVARSTGNIRMFSEFDLAWLRLAHCLRITGMSIADVKHYVELCLLGDDTVEERAEIIFAQEAKLKAQMAELAQQMEILKKKKAHYQELLREKKGDNWNPMTRENEVADE